MYDYSIKELEEWNKRIEEIVKKNGLDYYEQEFEIVSYEDMIGYEAYTGMPSHYPHWSYGKAFEKIKTLNKYNLSGLPYEMVINSDPCIAYLMKDNTLLLQVLTIAHVYGHNDFFKNNRMFKKLTRANNVLQMFKNHAQRIRSYIADPGIGYAGVERVLNAAHALKYQTARVAGEERLRDDQKMDLLMKRIQKPKSEYPLLETKTKSEEPLPDFKKIPLEPEEDLLYFISKYSRLEDWEKDIVDIVREEIEYFTPQIETKVMNEGWASFWHYTILNELLLPQGLHVEFLKRHNQVIRPIDGQINPYYIGFKIFEDLKRRHQDNPRMIFDVREIERDQSFIRKYLTRELCEELSIFEYEKQGRNYFISEVSDEEGWKKIRDTFVSSLGLNGIPSIKVTEWNKKDNSLLLQHQYDGRELEIDYAHKTLKHIVSLWDGRVSILTVIDGKQKTIVCDENKKLLLVEA